ncbi:MAG TPA: hypothetical protein DD490_12765 [Acidobacteria bacterium]|nr:hypothetical protein [Acidobacteriota bacterium]
MRRARRTATFLVAAFLGAAAPGAAGPAELLLDINVREVPATGGLGVAGPLVPAGGRVVFPAVTPGTGRELWSSDGTSLGTELLRELLPGGNAYPRFTPVGDVRGTALFLVDEADAPARGLWASDGTRQGTQRIADAFRCFLGGESIRVGSHLYFTAEARGVGCELWKTDGTAAGTGLVKDALPGPITALTGAAGRLFFFASTDLWVSDGTAAGTVLLQSLSERFDDRLPDLTAAGSRVFFLAPASSGEELWTSDGTPAGTRPVTDFFEPNPSLSIVTVIDGTLYLLANDGTGNDLWRSDGTQAGTVRVTDFIASHPFVFDTPGPWLTRLGNRLVFPAKNRDGELSRLWVSDGTPQTTRLLEGCPEGCPEVLATSLVRLGRRTVFSGFNQARERGLWVTDGTGSGTRRLAGHCAGCSGGFDSLPALFPLLGKVFFLAPDAEGFALWRTDGTPAGTMRLAGLGRGPLSPGNSPFRPVEVGGKVFFAAQLGQRGNQLWQSDGTPGGTGLVTLITGTPGSYPSGLIPFGGGVLFGACDGETVSLWRGDGEGAGSLHPPGVGGSCFIPDEIHPVVAGGLGFYLASQDPFSRKRLWRTDGTPAGTFPLVPEGLGDLREIVALGNRAVFTVDQHFHDSPSPRTAFWVSDGTAAGTRPLSQAEPTFYAWSLRAFGDRFYFLARDTEGWIQVWAGTGTAAPPQALTDLTQGFEFPASLQIAQAGSNVFFQADKRLWKTNGTAAGTVALMPPGSLEGALPAHLTAFQGNLYFTAAAGQSPSRRGLWRSDGTAAGTTLVSAAGFSEEPWLTVVGDCLYGVAGDEEYGNELWRSDGTAAGTVMVADLHPGSASSSLSELAAVDGRLYFAATDGASGIELWESDGTAAGTRRVQDLTPGSGSSNPRLLTGSGSRLFFTADDDVHGEEPWVLDLAGEPCAPTAEALCLGGRFRVEAEWRDFQGNRGRGHAAALTADTGTFWFFDAANVEVILKVLDGRGVNGHHWVFYGALSNVEYTLTVTDTQTGAVRRYVNPPGRLGSVADTEAFGPRGATRAGVVTEGPAPEAAQAPAAARSVRAVSGSCVPDATRLCLNHGRFAVEVRWKDFQGHTGTGQAVPLSGGDTGSFWFFDAGNVEVVLKVLDGRPLNGKFWVFYGALSNVEYTLTVTDTETGAVKTYTNPRGRLASVADTGAF